MMLRPTIPALILVLNCAVNGSAIGADNKIGVKDEPLPGTSSDTVSRPSTEAPVAPTHASQDADQNSEKTPGIYHLQLGSMKDPQNWAEGILVGRGWSGFKDIFAGADQSLYVIDQNDQMRWFPYTDSSRGQFIREGEGILLNIRWTGFREVFNGPNRSLYAITEKGILMSFRYAGLTPEGLPKWTKGVQAGIGWDIYEQVFNGPGQSLYAVKSNGDLQWHWQFDHEGYEDKFQPHGGVTAGTGWNRYRHLFAGQDQSIFGVLENGDLYWHAHITNVK